MRSFVAYNDLVRCLSCKYDLKNLTEHRCPECGREFDPNDPTTYFTRTRAITPRRFLRITLVAYALSQAITVYLSVTEQPGNTRTLLL
jgi:predicted amidophosphoribosyltransferase